MQMKLTDPRSFVDADCLGEYEDTILYLARKRVLRYLFSVGEAPMKKILEETNISLNILAAVYMSLENESVLLHFRGGLRLTENGRKWVIFNRKMIFMTPKRVRYSKSPDIEYQIVPKDLKKLPKKYRISRPKKFSEI